MIVDRASTQRFADRVAPRVSCGAPAEVRGSLQSMAESLLCGEALSAARLSWPQEPVRAAVLRAIDARSITEACRSSPALVAVVLEDVVDVCEIAWAQRRRMRSGHQTATRLDPADRAASEALISALWEPLAARGVEGELRERWRSLRSLLERARSALREGVRSSSAAPARATRMEDVFRPLSWWLASSADGRQLVARIGDRPSAQPRPSVVAHGPAVTVGGEQRSRAAWIRARGERVARAHEQLRGGASLSSARAGALYISADRTDGMREDEAHELRASVLVLLALGRALGRTTSLVVASASGAALAPITGDVRKDAVLALLGDKTCAPPMLALSRVLDEDRSALFEADFVVASVRAGLDYVFDPVTARLKAALEDARSEGFRAHLMRPATAGAIPHAALFDMFHFVEVPAAALIEADDTSSLPLR